jgi:hypothetical protein
LYFSCFSYFHKYHLANIKEKKQSLTPESGQTTTKNAIATKLKPIWMFRLMEIEKIKNLQRCLLCLVIKIEREIEQASGPLHSWCPGVLAAIAASPARSSAAAVGQPTTTRHRSPDFATLRKGR